jgi:opacity protein-like surface antigen
MRRRARRWALLRPGTPGTALPLLILALAVLLPATQAGAVRDWNRVDDPMAGALGLHLGKIGGVGLAYKYPPVWWLNLQIAGGIWHTGDDKRHNIGVELQYLLRQDSRLRIYAAAGGGYFYHKELHGSQPDEVKDHWNTGFGFGVEFLRWERISIQIEGDFTHEGDDEDFIFFPQAGLFFYF